MHQPSQRHLAILSSLPIVVALSHALSAPSLGAEPVTNDATPQARALLSFLASLSQCDEGRVLSGQFARWNHNASLEEIEAIHKKTGHWVAIIGGDYYRNDKKNAHPIDYRRTNDVLLEYARLGGIVSLSVHMNNPQTGGPAWDANIDLAEVLRPGSVAGRDWRRQLSLIADGLEAFKEANVPVLFRPYHEMDGRWFWWGGNPEQYKRLWRETFQYLARQRELNHLLWVYSPSHRGDQLKHYPGDRWVDVVGFDAYTSDLTGATKAYRQLLTTGKPVGITEYGPIDGQPRPGAPPFDWSLMATWLAEDFPKVTFFMAWRDHWGLAQHTGAKALLTHPLIRNRSAARTIPVVEECLQEKEQ